MLTRPVPNQDDETPITSRMPNGLVDEVQAIADETSRSRSKTIVLLLKKGIEAYRKDGVLGEKRALPNSAEEKLPKAKSNLIVAPPKYDLDLQEQVDELSQL